MTEIRIYHYGRFRCEGGIGNTDCLLQHALAAWNVHADRPVRLPAAVCRTQNGKPVIEGAAVSVAHPGGPGCGEHPSGELAAPGGTILYGAGTGCLSGSGHVFPHLVQEGSPG